MRHELLSPAGSLDICKAVLAAGADAVYLGGEKYGARAFAKNFSESDVLEALDLAHMQGKKIFLTVNTLLKNREGGRELFDYLEPFYKHGLDAIIVQDYGVFDFVHKHFPELALHCSTQMSVSNVQGAQFLKERGAERIVTARELSLSEIRAIYDATGMEIESFVHGALCYCYSGQCLMSSMLGGRSGNRGRCAQPCRLAYQVLDGNGNIRKKNEKFPLSPKDLNTISLIPEICEAGVYSFKIEGRMKQLDYAAGVTSVYRKYLDLYEQDPAHYMVDPKDLDYLMQLGNRNGFTDGYYKNRNGRAMMTLVDSSHSSGLGKATWTPQEPKKIPVDGSVFVMAGEPMSLTLECVVNDRTYSAYAAGEEVQAASNRPLDEAELTKRLKKTGDTPFVFRELQTILGDGCFVPVKQLNEMRRAAFFDLQEQMLADWKHHEVNTCEVKKEKIINHAKNPFLHVVITDPSQLNCILKEDCVDLISLDLHSQINLTGSDDSVASEYSKLLTGLCRDIKAAGKQAGFCFPYVFRTNSSGIYEKETMKQAMEGFDCVLVRSYDSLGFVKKLGLDSKKVRKDHNLYVYSNETMDAFTEAGFEAYTASLELNQKELAHMKNERAELCIYGYTPMMISAQCVYKNYNQCLKGKAAEQGFCLQDRYDKKFPVVHNCLDCYNVIYNTQPLSLFHQAPQIEDMGFESYRIFLLSESEKQIRQLMNSYRKAFVLGEQVDAPKDNFTNGHFRRGID